MSALGQLSQIRALREVKPYRPSVAPLRLKQEWAPKTDRQRTYLPHAKRLIARREKEPEEAIKAAYELGLYRGRHNEHYEPRNMATGAEWLSWLRGWRQGQVDYKLQRDAQAGVAAERELLMSRQLLITMAETQQAGPRMNATEVYEGSDGALTTEYYRELEARGGVLGLVAVNLFRAQKCSARAKVYRGGLRGRGSYKRMAYDRKQWSMGLLCDVLAKHADELGITWGWREDRNVVFGDESSWVLYIQLPEGQVSFHSPSRGTGPAFEGEWDGLHASCDRILAFCDRVFAAPDQRQMGLLA